MTIVYRAISRKIRSEGVALGLFLLVSRVLQIGRSAFYRLVLHAPGINIGPGCQVMGARFIQFGNNISIHRNLWLEAITEYKGEIFSPIIKIGDRVGFSNGVHISAINQITIGSDVLFGSHVFVSDHNHGRYSGDIHTPPALPPSDRVLHSGGAVIIEDNVWLGDNVNIVGPLRIGYGTVIAANSVVRTDVPPQTIVAGAPARVIKVYNESIEKWESIL